MKASILLPAAMVAAAAALMIGRRKVKPASTPQAPASPPDGGASLSENPAEQMQGDHRLGVAAGIGRTLPGDQDAPWLGRRAADAGEASDGEEITPGLPDFTRGA